MSLDDLPTRVPPSGNEPEAPVRRVDRAAPQRDKVTRAEELRLQLADEIVRGVLAPGSGLDETDIARRFAVSRTPSDAPRASAATITVMGSICNLQLRPDTAAQGVI